MMMMMIFPHSDALSSCALELPSKLAMAHNARDSKSRAAVRDVLETLELVLSMLSLSVQRCDAGSARVMNILHIALSSTVTMSALVALLAGSAPSANIADEYRPHCADIRTAVFRIASGKWWQGLGPLPLLFPSDSADENARLSPKLQRALEPQILQEAAHSMTANSWAEARAAAALMWELASPQMHEQQPEAASRCARSALPLLLSRLPALRGFALQARVQDCAGIGDDVDEASWPMRARAADALVRAIAHRAFPSISEAALMECIDLGRTLPLD